MCFVYMLSLVPPKIDFITPIAKVEVSKGASIKMECRASGNPAPKIIWSREVNSLVKIMNNFFNLI